MPAFSVAIDGNTIATVCTDGFNVMNVRASGTLVEEEVANLDLSGGSYPENGESTSLTWVNHVPLSAGQIITISFLESAQSSHAGKTIEELFPNEARTEISDFKPTAEIFEEIRAKSKLRNKYIFHLKTSKGSNFDGGTKPGDFGFALSVLWNWLSPERASMSLHSYTLESIEMAGPVDYLFDERLYFGDSVSFSLGQDERQLTVEKQPLV